jgi:hypothetical protein
LAQGLRAEGTGKDFVMLRTIGLLAVTMGFVNAASAKPPMAVPQAKELTPMERDHYVPETPSKSEYTPMLPPSRGKADETAGMNLLKFDLDRDLMPRLTLPLGLATLPGWVTR